MITLVILLSNITHFVIIKSMTNAIIKINPRANCPSEIIQSLVSIDVKYFDFDQIERIGKIEIHKELAEDIKKIFDLLYTEKFPIARIIPISEYGWDDEKSCNDNNSSGFNYRMISGTNRLSKHAMGHAIDINPFQNHYIKYEVTKDPDGNIINVKELWRMPNTKYDLGEKGTIEPNSKLVELFKKLGWEWGGDWTPESGRIDYQHFEKAPH